MPKPTSFLLLLVGPISALYAQGPGLRGTLQVTAHIEGSISAVFSAASNPASIIATGSSSASFSVPTLGGSFRQGGIPSGAGKDAFLISSPFTVRVVKANLLSASYLLRAALNVPDAKHGWVIDGVNISSGDYEIIAPNESYEHDNPHTLVVSGPAFDSSKSAVNAITFQVIAN